MTGPEVPQLVRKQHFDLCPDTTRTPRSRGLRWTPLILCLWWLWKRRCPEVCHHLQNPCSCETLSPSSTPSGWLWVLLCRRCPNESTACLRMERGRGIAQNKKLCAWLVPGGRKWNIRRGMTLSSWPKDPAYASPLHHSGTISCHPAQGLPRRRWQPAVPFLPNQALSCIWVFASVVFV